MGSKELKNLNIFLQIIQTKIKLKANIGEWLFFAQKLKIFRSIKNYKHIEKTFISNRTTKYFKSCVEKKCHVRCNSNYFSYGGMVGRKL